MRRKQLRKVFPAILLLALLFTGCDTLRTSYRELSPSGKMENYAETRYNKAINYMKVSRFELAQEQFALVAATTNSPELRQRALEAYTKADRSIALKR